MRQSSRLWTIGAKHPAFGEEGLRWYYGTANGALRAARKIARAGGHGWEPLMRESEEQESEITAPSFDEVQQ